MIKKRTRPQARAREISPEAEENKFNSEDSRDDNDEMLPYAPTVVSTFPSTERMAELSLADLIELRKLRKARQGIDSARLSKGDVRKRKRRPAENEQGGLRKGVRDDDDDDEDDMDARARRVVRSNNFTQQTNALDVDKHMMTYIEENLKIRSRPRDDADEPPKPLDPQEALYHIADRWKMDKAKPGEEGSVTNSMSMLTAIPEVDLGMDARLKNIEETEKAKRVVAEERQDRRKPNHDEDHLVANRFYRPDLRPKSDADIIRDAKLEAMGLPPQDDQPRQSNHDRPQMATDEIVMERFKKRMRK